jgi:hypothetical protein
MGVIMALINGDIRLSGLAGPVRRPAVAGSFYPADPGTLAETLRVLLEQTHASSQGAPKILIAPHAGYVYSGPVAASAYALLAPQAAQIRRVILLGPAHRVALRGLAVPAVDRFRTPLGDIPLDRAAIDSLTDLPQVRISDEAHAQEHSLEVHLPFLQTLLPDFSLVPLVVGHVPPAAVAQVLERLWGGPETLIIISTDLSHYHDYDTARRLDGETCAAIEKFRFESIGPEQACGCMPMAGALLVARQRGMQIQRLDVRNSGDTAGGRDRVVGYAAFALRPPAPSDGDHDGDLLLDLARNSVAHGLRTGRPPEHGLEQVAAELRKPAAAFVTLTLRERLRGCIGSTEPVEPLVRAVTNNAFRAAFRDPRFPALTTGEFADVRFSISILSTKQQLEFNSEDDLIRQLRPGSDGLVISRGHKSATFLPSVWETLPAAEQFVVHLKRKAGLADMESPTHAWRYTACYYSE